MPRSGFNPTRVVPRISISKLEVSRGHGTRKANRSIPSLPVPLVIIVECELRALIQRAITHSPVARAGLRVISGRVNNQREAAERSVGGHRRRTSTLNPHGGGTPSWEHWPWNFASAHTDYGQTYLMSTIASCKFPRTRCQKRRRGGRGSAAADVSRVAKRRRDRGGQGRSCDQCDRGAPARTSVSDVRREKSNAHCAPGR